MMPQRAGPDDAVAADDGGAAEDQPQPGGQPGRPGWRGWPAWAWAACLGLGLGLLALGPGLAPGYLLSYDMVFVPGPPVSAALLGLTGGPPRAVPSDAVVAVLARAVPADAVQKTILILIFVLACSGAAALLTSGWRRARGENPPLPAALAAGVFYAWNPFVAERLLIGQWALLLGYAGLPWVVRALGQRGSRIALVPLWAALLPAAVGGFAAMAISALAAVPAAWLGGERGGRVRRLGTVLLAMAVLSLPWLIPALAVPVHTDPRGVDAFAARADTPFGRAGSLVMLSGIWNSQTVPRGYGGAPSAVWLLVVAAAIGGYLLRARPLRLSPGLGTAGIAGLLVAAIGLTPASRGALADLVRFWPGFAVLRDGQQYLAPLALAEAIGLGGAVAWLLRQAQARPASQGRSSSAATAALAVMAMLAPVLLLPGMAWGSAGRLRPVEYPADWSRARRLIDGDPRAGTVLLLPWAAYRRYPWNGGEAVYDPWTELTHREVISSTALQVGSQTLAPESADSIRLNRIVMAPGPMTRALAAAGVAYVIVDAGPLLARPLRGLASQARLPGASLVLASRDLVVFRLPLLAEERR
jgi:hypothetical protein